MKTYIVFGLVLLASVLSTFFAVSGYYQQQIERDNRYYFERVKACEGVLMWYEFQYGELNAVSVE